MTYDLNTIKYVQNPVVKTYSKNFADCVILTHDNKILMQKRPDNWHSCPGALNIFGGHVEHSETIIQALIRELNEETGALASPENITFIGAISEEWTNHTELVHVHFWHDQEKTITGCYEAEARIYNKTEDALSHPQIMDYAAWALIECRDRKLIP